MAATRYLSTRVVCNSGVNEVGFHKDFLVWNRRCRHKTLDDAVPPTRRIEDYIRSLCQKLIEAEEGSEEFKTISSELQAVLSKQIGQIRTRFKDFPQAQERRTRIDWGRC